MADRIKTAICDDEPRAISIISGAVESTLRDMGAEPAVETFLGPEELLDKLKTRTFDLIFLDISMPKKDGIELGRELKERGSTAAIVFVSSRTDRMFDTFAVQPFGFVRKNRFLDDLGDVLSRYLASRRADDGGNVVRFRDGQGTLSIDIGRVKYIENVRNAQVFHFEDGEEHRLYSRMETLEEELKKYGFIRIHKGYLAQTRFIRRFDKTAVTLTTGEELPIGRSRQKEAMEEYLRNIGRE